MHAAQEHGGRACVVGAGIGTHSARSRMREVGHDVKPVSKFFERRQDLGKREALAFVRPASTYPWWLRAERRCSSSGSSDLAAVLASGVCAGTIESSSGRATRYA